MKIMPAYNQSPQNNQRIQNSTNKPNFGLVVAKKGNVLTNLSPVKNFLSEISGFRGAAEEVIHNLGEKGLDIYSNTQEICTFNRANDPIDAFQTATANAMEKYRFDTTAQNGAFTVVNVTT